MSPTRYTPEQVINKFREAETMLAGGRTVAQVLQHPGLSEATFNRWRNHVCLGNYPTLMTLDQSPGAGQCFRTIRAAFTLGANVLRDANVGQPIHEYPAQSFLA